MKTFIKRYKYQIIIILFTFVLYGRVIGNGYNLDDPFVIENNKLVKKGIKAIPDIFKSRYSNREGLNYGYRPITKSYFAILYTIFGERIYIYHLFSLLIFSSLSLLIFNLFKQLFSNIKEDVLFYAVLLFISYPPGTEVVASLKNNEQIFSSIFSILSFILILRYIDYKKIIYLIFSFVLFIFAILSKLDSLAYFPIIILGLFLLKGVHFKKIIYISLIFILVIVIFKYLKNGLPNSERITLYIENPLFIVKNIEVKFATSIFIIFYFITKLIYPLNLNFYYGYSSISLHDFSEIIIWIELFLLITIPLFLFYISRKNKQLLFLFSVIIIISFLYSNLLKPLGGVFADRFLFIPSIFFMLLISILLFKYFKSYKIIISVLILIFSVLTFTRNGDWKNREELYTADIKDNKSVKANELYASMIIKKLQKRKITTLQLDSIKLSEKYFKKCLEIYPNHYSSLNNLGLINLLYYKKYNTALNYFNNAEKNIANTQDIKIIYNIAFTQQKIGNFGEAIKYYNKVLIEDSLKINVYYNLSDIFLKLNDIKKLKTVNYKIIKINPSADKPYINIGRYYFFNNDTINAIKWLKKAYNINPNNKQVETAINNYK